jgi:hypothetical protein
VRGVGARCSGTGLRLSISYDTDGDEIRIIHHRAKRDAERITKFPALVDRPRRFCIDMAEGEIGSEKGRQGKIENARVDLGIPPGTLKCEMSFCRPSASRLYSGRNAPRDPSIHRQDKMAGAPWPVLHFVRSTLGRCGGVRTGTNDVEKVETRLADDPADVGIHQDEAGTCTPMTE